MLVVASGSLLPSVEDWFGARHELRIIQPLLDELSRRHPNVGIGGVRPRGPLLFRVAEQMSMISDALYLEATRALGGGEVGNEESDHDSTDSPDVEPEEQALRIAEWINAGRDNPGGDRGHHVSRATLLRQPPSYSDREWILAIADQYRTLENRVSVPSN